MKPARLHAVEPVDEPAPSLDYEWQQRQHVLSRDWARVHVRGDRSAPLAFFGRTMRTWLR